MSRYWDRLKILNSVHEAAHGFAVWYFGGVLKEIELTDYDVGRCSYEHPGLNPWKHDSLDDPVVQDGILITLVGIAAMSRKALQVGDTLSIWDTDGGRDDLILTKSRCCLIDPDAGIMNHTLESFYREYGSEARMWVYDRSIWNCIEALATALIEKRQLDGREAVSIILDSWNGKKLPEKALPLEKHGKKEE